MNKPIFLNILLSVALIALFSCSQERVKRNNEITRDINFNKSWFFSKIENDSVDDNKYSKTEFDHSKWQKVNLPHTANIEPLVVNDQWQGIAWYRKEFALKKSDSGKVVYVELGAAMQVADIWVNGTHIETHYGGYLPFSLDITNYVNFDQSNLIALKLDNRDNINVPPGKPIKTLDFCYYGGLYRNVKMHIVNPLHISNAIEAEKIAGGGIFVQYDDVSSDSAVFSVKTHILNKSNKPKAVGVQTEISDPDGKIVILRKSKIDSVTAMSDTHFKQDFVLKKPQLWDIDSPKRYTVKSYVFTEEVVDYLETNIGFRSISFSVNDGFLINGKKKYLRGTNRHQEYPYIGNALSDEAQYRDAYKIKQAGFDYIRLSHYPQADAFMDACDELGLVVMNCIPGWQFMGGEKFQELCYQNIRDLIRRDRNRPSVILWETSLNESWMEDDFIETSQKITHEELPGKYTYSCGWQKGFDVFIQARQHGGLNEYNDPEVGAIISEYGDWEYFAQNAGLDQPGFKNLLKEERNSRQFRASGEKRLLQQAMNFQEAHNDNQKTVAAGDGLWVMFDYNRGYDNTIEASGPMDVFRLPKFSHYFFQSQRDVQVDLKNGESNPMVFIANYWTDNSPLDVRVFSNCTKVKLFLNGDLIGVQKPDENEFTSHLKHPPFTFKLKKFTSGELTAVGLIDEHEEARHTVKTPGKPAAIKIEFDISGKPFNRESQDIVFAYAKIIDENGTVVPDFSGEVQFDLVGPATLIGQNPIKAEAGIATILLQNKKQGKIEVSAKSKFMNTNLFGEEKIN
ncbi:MAG: DUF4982 domain-containing protein [Calditrichaeota bacterium]|nr:MAG: DUF4982 domain-containing protein [Calditrichota bacterium]MBL1207067.1 DUF4982 domain-containing protein [Calditrichota bacterium]NOG46897.1 DUF4982 domain-containing protein [Calditrichota bacterium]